MGLSEVGCVFMDLTELNWIGLLVVFCKYGSETSSSVTAMMSLAS
jgi:hypothetical protein